MKTTPNPKATKNSNGELVAPFPWLLFVLSVFKGVGAADVNDGSDVDEVALLNPVVVALLKPVVALPKGPVGDGAEGVLKGSVACLTTALTTAWTPWARASWTTAMLIETDNRIGRIQIRISYNYWRAGLSPLDRGIRCRDSNPSYRVPKSIELCGVCCCESLFVLGKTRKKSELPRTVCSGPPISRFDWLRQRQADLMLANCMNSPSERYE